MNDDFVKVGDTDLKEVEKSLEDTSEFGYRHIGTWEGTLIAFIAGAWSIFQLLLPKILLINSEYIRCIHLAFAICLVFLSYPALRTKRISQASFFRFLVAKEYIPWSSYLLATLGSFSALYLMLDYEGIAMRMGAPNTTDIVMGIILIVLLLEAARRALGPALPIIASTFIFYSFFSESMPDIISFKNASLNKVMSKLTLSTDGIFGVPLDVSAGTVFLFVLFGAMLDRAGGGKYFIELAFSVLGRFRGGPAKAAVLSSGLTGLVSGSSIANTVTTGTFTIPLMKRSGYPATKAGAIEVAASTNGQLMPPIMGAAAFIIAEYCNISYYEVIRAAAIPALISYIALIYITHLEAKKLKLEGIPKEELPYFWKTLSNGLYYLIPLGFLLYQLMIERRSPELSAFYAILALMVVMLIRQLVLGRKQRHTPLQSIKVAFSEIWESFVAGGRNMMGIGVAVATAGIIVGIVTLGVGGIITELIDLIAGGNLILLLLITAVASLILGMGLPTTANYIVMATLTVPTIVVLGEAAGLVVPLVGAHLFCFYFGILADDTPPVALAAYAASAISKADPIKTGVQGFIYDLRTAILPFMFIFNTDLLLINIEGFWGILTVFVTALMAMFAFAALTQNYFYVRNKFYESILLGVSTLLLLRPDILQNAMEIPRNGSYGIGAALFVSLYGFQRLRAQRNQLAG